MSLADQIIEHGPYDATVHPRYGAQTYSFTGADLNELRDELIAARARPDEAAPETALSAPVAAQEPSAGGNGWAEALAWLSGRFEIEVSFTAEEAVMLCRTCRAEWALIDITDLAELVRRAGEHTEVCR